MFMRIGIDIGGTTVTVGMLDDNSVINKETIKTYPKDGADKVIKRINLTIQSVIDQSGACLSDISHIGIGCAGMLDRSRGTIIYSNNFGWKNVLLKDKIQKVFPLPVYLENDANCAALGEYVAGTGKDYNSMVMVTFGTGIGGGIIFDDKLFRGNNGFSSIIGHLLLVTDGELCTCGRKGCWEAYGSVNALVKDAGELADQNPDSMLKKLSDRDGELNGKNIFEAIRQNDKAACELFSKFIHYMAEGVTDIVHVFNPQSIIIGGGISEQGEIILEPLRELVLKYTYCGATTMPVIKTASLGNEAGIVGAANLDKYHD
ncbi:MAG: ROK family protein [Anaerolineaceae bacterium]|nr:MAG: ROK family protein [Anaerolineaceae bacterium]